MACTALAVYHDSNDITPAKVHGRVPQTTSFDGQTFAKDVWLRRARRRAQRQRIAPKSAIEGLQRSDALRRDTNLRPWKSRLVLTLQKTKQRDKGTQSGHRDEESLIEVIGLGHDIDGRRCDDNCETDNQHVDEFTHAPILSGIHT